MTAKGTVKTITTFQGGNVLAAVPATQTLREDDVDYGYMCIDSPTLTLEDGGFQG
jgi:hypothetical protein